MDILLKFFIAIIKTALLPLKFLKQKQAEASVGFHKQLGLQLNCLYLYLNDKELLEINAPEKGNIFALKYNSGTQKKVCPAFKKPSDGQFNDIKKLASQLKKTLIESENNVYPKTSEETRWNDSQQILLKFCEFVEQKSMGDTNKARVSGENGEYKHTKMCRELVDAMKYIMESIK